MTRPLNAQVDPALAANLRAARARSKLSQRDVAKRIGVSQPSLSLWERGEVEPTLSMLRKLAATYGTSAARLLTSDGYRPARAARGR